MLASLLACASFAFLNNGRWQEWLAAGVGGAVGKFVQIRMRRFRVNQLADVALAATAAGLAFMLVALVMHAWFPASAQLRTPAFTSALLFLVPGFPLLTAALDLARFDFSAGVSRLFFTCMVTLAASLGAWLVAFLFGLTPESQPAPAFSWGVLLVLRVLASLLGVLGFALTFNTPMRVAMTAAVIGTAANLLRLYSVDHGLPVLVAAALATVVVGLLANDVSQRWLVAPRITLSVPAVLIMVPGAPTYRALVAMIGGDSLGALDNGMTSVGIVIALAVGLATARMLTDPVWIASNPTWTDAPGTQAQQLLRSLGGDGSTAVVRRRRGPRRGGPARR